MWWLYFKTQSVTWCYLHQPLLGTNIAIRMCDVKRVNKSLIIRFTRMTQFPLHNTTTTFTTAFDLRHADQEWLHQTIAMRVEGVILSIMMAPDLLQWIDRHNWRHYLPADYMWKPWPGNFLLWIRDFALLFFGRLYWLVPQLSISEAPNAQIWLIAANNWLMVERPQFRGQILKHLAPQLHLYTKNWPRWFLHKLLWSRSAILRSLICVSFQFNTN